MNDYDEIAAYYDMLMDAGYYDHQAFARLVHSEIGQRKKLLELGIGTGRLARELLELDSAYEIMGIDLSTAMIKIARRRLSAQTPIIECDVTEMKLDRQFDVAISCGGAWVIVRTSEELQLGTHRCDYEKDLRGLRNVADHLVPGGLLLLSVHPPHEDRSLELRDGIMYSQAVRRRLGGKQGDGRQNGAPGHYSIEKSYCFKKEKKILASEILTLGFYSSSLFEKIFADAGLKPMGMIAEGQFFSLEKIA